MVCSSTYIVVLPPALMALFTLLLVPPFNICVFKVVDGEQGSEDKEVKEKYKCHLCDETFTFSWGLNR